MFFNRILPNPVWLPAVIQRTTAEELAFLQSHPQLQSSIAEFASVETVLALLPRFQAIAAAAKAAPVPELISGSELTDHPAEWVWPGRIARGKLTLIGGAPGSGKTTLAMDMIGRVTTGADWPCEEGVAPKGSVLLIAPQSHPDTFVPRLKAAGADLARLHTLRTVKEGARSRRFNLEKDITTLDPLISGIKDLQMIVIDAVDVPAGRGRAAAREAGALFDALAELAQRHNVAVLAIAHPAGADYLSRKPVSFGTLPLSAACAAFLVEADPADAGHRLLLQVKNELAYDPGSLSFCIMERLNRKRPGETAAGVMFAPQKLALDACEFSARQARGFNSAKAEAIGFLRALFADRTHHKVREIEQEARAMGLLGANQPLSQCRALRDARMALGLLAMREGFGKDGAWVWVWPDAMEAQQQQDEPQSETHGESDPQERADVPSAAPAASVTSPPLAAAQLQASVPIPKFV
ncbi:MAG: AAA family ATPase [Xanthobacteraceae bacterium]|nr:AAA family ATPase [Xanthobacteraceae bacterium]